jgi:hypothetical protein
MDAGIMRVAVGAAAALTALGPGGSTVYVTGSSAGTTSWSDYATVAYRALYGWPPFAAYAGSLPG